MDILESEPWTHLLLVQSKKLAKSKVFYIIRDPLNKWSANLKMNYSGMGTIIGEQFKQ